MAEAPTLLLRPLEGNSHETLEGSFRIHLFHEDAKTLRLQPGDLCRAVASSDSSIFGVGIVWVSSLATKKIVKTSHSFREAFGFKLGDRLQISRYDGSLNVVSTVRVKEVASGAANALGVSDEELQSWVKHSMLDLDAVWPGGQFSVAPKTNGRRCKKRTFVIEDIVADEGAEALPRVPYALAFATEILLLREGVSPAPCVAQEAKEHDDLRDIDSSVLGGLDNQIRLLNQHIQDMQRIVGEKEMNFVNGHSQLGSASHVLLYGAPGTGKSLVLSELKSSFRNHFALDASSCRSSSGKTDEVVKRTFNLATSHQPSLLTIDDLDIIAGRSERESPHQPLASALRSEIHRVEGAKIFVVAAAHRPNDVDAGLRLAFDTELELPIPDAVARLDILRRLWRSPKQADDDKVLNHVADRTHGYVGRDLETISRKAFRHVRRRLAVATSTQSTAITLDTTALHNMDGSEECQPELELEDFEAALRETIPSAMREVFLETPKVQWTDIGGSDHVKDALDSVVDFPFRRPDLMSFYKLSAPRGILLYGPPGCSKTLTAKAVATSSGLNFLSVKGAELTSMYVGETERAMRELFRKARAAKPSVIFFDEIDAIASTRAAGKGDAGSGLHGVNVLTTLLTEMDGVENLDSVLVLAATNRPETLDPALLRPGRFESIIYVAPPNLDARRQILEIATRGRSLRHDVDLLALAKVTEGYSGADITGLCDRAAWAAGLRADKRGTMGDNELGSDHNPDGVSTEDFQQALSQRGSSISPDMVASYEAWAAGLEGISRMAT